MCAPLTPEPTGGPVLPGTPGTPGGTGGPLVGSRCDSCSNVAFPPATGCQRCGARTMAVLPLSTRGRVWGHTVQRFAPKSPPYVVPVGGFVPFAVGYVELAEGIKVEAVLDCSDFDELPGAEVELVATSPVPRFATTSAARVAGATS